MPSEWSTEDTSAPGIHVRGGSHGLTVEYRELESAAAALEESVAHLSSLRSGCVEVYLLLSATSAVHTHARHAAGAAELVLEGLARNMQELEEAARDLRRAARNYLEVEQNLGAAIPWRQRVAMGMGMWQAAGWGYPDRTVSELMVPQHDWMVVEALLGLLAGGRYGKLRPINVAQVEPGEGSDPVPPPRTAHDLLARSKVLLDGPDRSVVEILTVNRGGQPLRIVTFPGTQSQGLFVGPNPFDNYGNAEGRAEDSQYIADAVADALRLAGASAEDGIILVGYSQGGIHAVNAGARLAEEGKFRVDMIMTAGAPAGDRDTPDGVKVLHFEHYQDWVAGLDGSANPDTRDRITVTGTRPAGNGGGALGPAHELDGLLALAGQADASEDRSLNETLGQLAEIIPPGSIVTRSLFRFSRERVSLPKKPPEPERPQAKVPRYGQNNRLPSVPPRSIETGLQPPFPFMPPVGAEAPLLPARPGQ